MARGNIVTAIDIGTEKICTIISTISEETNQCNVIGVATASSVGIKKSQIVDLESAIGSITDSVEAAERMAGYNVDHAYVSISGSHIQSQNSTGVVAVADPEAEITPMDVDRVIEAARAVSMPSAREIIHVIPRDYTVDSQHGIKDPIGMSGVRLEAKAHLITGSSTAIKNTQKTINELGINVDGVVFSALASSYSVLSETEKELGVVLVDIGAGTTSMTVFVEGSIAYSTVIPVGARNITNDIAIGMRVSLQDAEKIKLYLSNKNSQFVPSKGTKASDIAKARKEHDTLDLQKLGIKDTDAVVSKKAVIDGIIMPRLNELFDLLQKQLKEDKLEGVTPAGIVLTGGGAATVGIVDSCKRKLNLPARVGMPTGLHGLIDELNSPMYATAAGTILYSQKDVDRERSGKGGGFKPSLPSFNAVGNIIKTIKSFLP